MCLDFEALGIKCREALPTEESYFRFDDSSRKIRFCNLHWIISLFKEEDDANSFHFVRKSYCGDWYHKMGYFASPLQYDYDHNKIVDPRTCNLGKYQYVKTYELSCKQDY